MKLRCTTNSIRMRIRKSELQQLAKGQRITEQIGFGQGVVFTFSLDITTSKKQVVAYFLNNNLIVKLPKAIAKEWINSNQVGIEVKHPIEKDQNLHILIEKIFLVWIEKRKISPILFGS